MTEPDALPVMVCLPQIDAAIRTATPIVLKAPPGAGKTTAVPLHLLRRGDCPPLPLLLIQPRRLAARAAASRLAALAGTRVGDQVGYHVRFDKRVSRDTQIIAMTTGVLLRRLQQDPFLDGIGCVILDEFHERSIEMDLALGMLQRIRTTFRPELRLILMSATLDPGPLVEYLVDGVEITSEGRQYPVQIRHAPATGREPLERQVAAVVPQVMQTTPGHLLVFLPGVGEIRRAHRELEGVCKAQGVTIHELFGDMAADAQDAVLTSLAQRKLILATNVAETSVTIPGVTAVVDSGLAKVMHYESEIGLPRLVTQAISRASADQRAGRAGRTAPGLCVRLWPSAADRGRRDRDQPEILRSDFSAAMLTLLSWGEHDVSAFPWLTPPHEDAVMAAERLLLRLGAMNASRQLTEIGQRMLTLPTHPRLARFLIEAERLQVVEHAVLAAAALTERDPFRGTHAPSPLSLHTCDVCQEVERIQAADQRGEHSRYPGLRQLLRTAKQFSELLDAPGQVPAAVSADASDTSVRLRQALLTAYPDRVARRREGSSDRGRMVGGRGVRIDPSSSVRAAELFLCVDVQAAGTEALVRKASALEPGWLEPLGIREVDEPFWHPSLQAVVVRRRRYFDDLLLSETPIECVPNEATASLLYEHVKQDSSIAFPVKDAAIEQWVNRARFLEQHMPELKLPRLDEETLLTVLQSLCRNAVSVQQLRGAPWLDHLRGLFSYDQLQQIERHAPARMSLPSGNSSAIQYAADRAPWIEVRIQEIFGWRETPRVAGGRIALQLHLLGPNYRPQQITDDLHSFWTNTYLQIRKDLRARYPKHHWPEDPWQATATRNGLKPR